MPPRLSDSAPSRDDRSAPRERPARSVLKRALLGLLLLAAFASGGAWLWHAGIEAEAEAGLAQVVSESAHPPR